MKVKGKRIVYQLETRRMPDGRTTTLDVIYHPGAVLIVPFLNANQLVFIRQYRAILKEYLYELPAGTLNPKENLLSCAKRELAEEIGYGAKSWKKLGKIYPVPGYSTEVIHIFKAQKLFPQKAKMDDDEMIEPIVLTRRQAQEYFKRGKIEDGKTICGLALAGWL